MIKRITAVKGFDNLTISYKSKLPNDVYGLCHADKGLIEISLKQNSTQEMLEASLWHELLHLAFYRSGWGEVLSDANLSEEGVVIMLENAFRQIISFEYEEKAKV